MTAEYDPSTAAAFYRTMRMIRRFEERVVELVNTNEIPGVTHEYVGQEAVATGICAALKRTDVITSTHRGHGHLIAKGASVAAMMAELLARETGLNRARGGSMHIADLSLGVYGANGIVAAGVPIAAGAAWSAKHCGEPRIAVAFFGDGAINQGVLYETINLAATWELPLVFVCENNSYAVTTPITDVTATTIAERASATGVEALVVDGMNVGAVNKAATTAVSRARAGQSTFLECKTYRFFGHHTAERIMQLRYRSDDEIERWRALDPLKTWPAESGLGAEQQSTIDADVERELDTAIDFARSSPQPRPETALDYAYASLQDATFPEKGWLE